MHALFSKAEKPHWWWSPPFVHELYSGPGLPVWAGLTWGGGRVPLARPWSCQSLSTWIPVLTGWLSHCSLVGTVFGNGNFLSDYLNNHWESVAINHRKVNDSQCYCRPRNRLRIMKSILQERVRDIIAAFNLKCKQSQIKHPSSRHLLELNSNPSSLRLLPLFYQC